DGASPESGPCSQTAAAEHLVLDSGAIFLLDLQRPHQSAVGAGAEISPSAAALENPRQEQASARGSLQRFCHARRNRPAFAGSVPERHCADLVQGVPVLPGQELAHPLRRGGHIGRCR
ncbi:unnamed protein product, partial [Effrenium voratum]